MRTPFFTALLAALLLHVVGLLVLSLGWQTWHLSFPLSRSDLPVRVAVVQAPEPTPPPALLAEPLTVPRPVALAPTELTSPPRLVTPPLPAPSVPLSRIDPPPLRRVEPRPPAVPAPREPPRRPSRAASQPAPTRREPPRAPPPGLPHEPQGSAGNAPAGPAPAVPEPPQLSGGGTEADQLSAHSAVPVAPGSGGGSTGGADQGGRGSGVAGDGAGTGSARTGTGSGAGGGTGAGRGGASSGTGTAGAEGVSARPLGGYQVKPRYPESARRQGVEGTVLLKMRITERGRVEDVQVERSAGHPDLDHSAMEAVRRWRFEPARQGSTPVAMWVLIPVEFKLQ